MIFYIADTHFHDERVIRLSKRPFVSVEEHDQELVRRWNNKVNDNDEVYMLGDISADDYPGIISLLKSLKGKKHLITGNHDLKNLVLFKSSRVFETVDDVKFIKDEDRDVILFHYPLMDWRTIIRGSILVYGHIHNKSGEQGKEYEEILNYYKDKPAYNAGVDVTNYEPVTLNELIKLKEER